MLRFAVKGCDISLSFSFFAIIALAAASDAKAVAVSLLCCIMHETGHLAAMAYYGASINEICFYGGGIKINAAPAFLGTKQQAAVLLAGCAVNAAAYFACAVAGATGTMFATANLMLCVFNLLPLKKLDGGRLTELLTGQSHGVYTAVSALRIVTLLIMALLLLKAFVMGAVSFTLVAAALYIVASEALCM